MSYTSYMSYRVAFGTSQTCLRVQGVFPPAWAWGSAPHLPIN